MKVHVGCWSITILCWILVFFFSSKWAEFLHVVSNLIENHSPVFLSVWHRMVMLRHLQLFQFDKINLYSIKCSTTGKYCDAYQVTFLHLFSPQPLPSLVVEIEGKGKLHIRNITLASLLTSHVPNFKIHNVGLMYNSNSQI